MTHFFKTIIRGFQNTSIHHFNSKSSFLGNVVSTFIEDSPEVQPTPKPSKIYFDAPLAGDMSCFNKTDNDFLPGKAEEKESPVNPVSIPFMITKVMKMGLLEKGYTMEDIKNMTPKEAHEILNKK